MIDIGSIIAECGIGSNIDFQMILKNINMLKNQYSEAELVLIYINLLKDVEDIFILKEVIKLADECKNPEILTLLIDMLVFKKGFSSEYDEEDIVNFRIFCVKAISNYKDTSTVSAYLYCLNDKDEHYRVRLACAEALGRLGDRFAVTPLIDVLEDEEEKSVYLKEAATSALAEIGDIRAIDPLVFILEAKQGLLGKFSFLKERAIEALGKLSINNNKVMSAFKNALMDSSPMVRINAIEAIMNSGEDCSVELIRRCLNDDDTEVRENALIALYNLDGRDILDEVLLSSDYSDDLKIKAKELIEEYEECDE